jgi:ATP-dependent protease HslVU (ClpYQ) ATPase subunit
MKKMDRLEQHLDSLKKKLKLNEMDEKNIEIALEEWVVESFQNKIKERGRNNDKKSI